MDAKAKKLLRQKKITWTFDFDKCKFIAWLGDERIGFHGIILGYDVLFIDLEKINLDNLSFYKFASAFTKKFQVAVAKASDYFE